MPDAVVGDIEYVPRTGGRGHLKVHTRELYVVARPRWLELNMHEATCRFFGIRPS